MSRVLEDQRSFGDRGSLERRRGLRGFEGSRSLEQRLQQCPSGSEASRSCSREQLVRGQSLGTGKGNMHQAFHRVLADWRG